MEPYLVFRFDGVLMRKAGLVHATSGEHAIEVAKRSGMLAPIVQLKKEHEQCSTVSSNPLPSLSV